MTRPDEWSPHCVHAATRVSASNLDPKRARTFYGDVLLERCRDDIREHRRQTTTCTRRCTALCLSQLLVQRVLLPLVKSGDCTLRRRWCSGRSWPRPRCPRPTRPVVIMKLAELLYRARSPCF